MEIKIFETENTCDLFYFFLITHFQKILIYFLILFTVLFTVMTIKFGRKTRN